MLICKNIKGSFNNILGIPPKNQFEDWIMTL